MEWYFILIICLSTLLFLSIAAFLILWFIFEKRFNLRQDGDPRLKYLSNDDFDSLLGEPISFKSNKGQNLRGFVYYRQGKKYKGLILFIHGIGGGHMAYTTEINFFAQNGYKVFAFDTTGSMHSEGKGMVGVSQGIIDVEYALNYIKQDNKLSKMDLYIFGHSLGGYIAINSLRIKNNNIKKAVILSGFKSLSSQVVGQKKIFILLVPLIKIYGLLKFGLKGNYDSLKTMQKTKVPVLFIQGYKDRAVPFIDSGMEYKNKANNPLVKFLFLESKYHYPYLSDRAESYLNKVFKSLKGKGEDNILPIDYKLICEEDTYVMNEILEFLRND